MNLSKEALAVIGGLAGLVIFFTLIGGGTIGLGTSPLGPSFNLGFTGPQYRRAA